MHLADNLTKSAKPDNLFFFYDLFSEYIDCESRCYCLSHNMLDKLVLRLIKPFNQGIRFI